ncbi:MAG TPA: outer membrane protein [Azospirillaceae bacterium]|nr:outer membrane protein [Azospirillaceae bacterium]
MKNIGLALVAASLSLIAATANAQTGRSTPVRPDADSGIYIRGSLGYSWSAEDEIDYSPLWGVGIGYRLSPNLRADITFDWRDRFIVEGAGLDSQIENQSYMLNVYYDLDQLPVVQFPGGFKPYIGAGIGVSYVEVDDQVIPGTGGTFANLTGDDDANFAWQAMIGVAYQVTPQFAGDLAYRYAHLGEVQATSPFGNIDNDLNVSEVVLTLRYNF